MAPARERRVRSILKSRDRCYSAAKTNNRACWGARETGSEAGAATSSSSQKTSEFLIKCPRHGARPCGSHPQHPEWCLAPRMSDAYRKNSVPQLGTGVLGADELVKSKGARNSIQNRPSFGSSSRVPACSLPVTEERRNAGGRLLPELRSVSFAGSARATLTEPTPSSPPRSKTASERRRV